MQLEKQLDKMLDKRFMYKTVIQKVTAYKVNGESVSIVTDKNRFEFQLDRVKDIIDLEFLPVANEVSKGTGASVLTVQSSEVFNPLDGVNVLDTLKESLVKLRTDPAYILQAREISNTVNTMMNVVKTEIQIFQLNKRKG